jgi:hypothetical protein
LTDEKTRTDKQLSSLQERLDFSNEENKKLKHNYEIIKKHNQTLLIRNAVIKDEIFEEEITSRQADLQNELSKINEERFDCSNEAQEHVNTVSNKKSCKTPTCNGLDNIDGVLPFHYT